mgnify:CR=1 FL=1
MLKVLAFALYFDPKLVVEPTFEDEYKPDLLIRADDYRPELWVECGAVSVRKLDKISFRYYTSRFAVVKQQQRLAELLSGRNDVVAVISGDTIQVVIGGVTEASKLHRLP